MKLEFLTIFDAENSTMFPMTNVTKKWLIEPLTALRESFSGTAWQAAVSAAEHDNEWFTPANIERAAHAIREQMLDPDNLQRWTDRYPAGPPAESLRIEIVMAGNLPMVGMADLVAVVVSGHRAVVKPSSRDRALMGYLCSELQRLGADLEVVDDIQPHTVDRLIATGSDRARAHFGRTHADSIPTLLRGSRTSVALLYGQPIPREAQGLATDIFAYWGLGCRNVTRLLVPSGFDPLEFVRTMEPHLPPKHPKFNNCYRHLWAMESMCGSNRSTNGNGFVLTHLPLTEWATPAMAQLFFSEYTDQQQASLWIAQHQEQLQCTVTDLDCNLPRRVAIGSAQYPALWDYADGVDTIEFLG